LQEMISKVSQVFCERFGSRPSAVARAPGRVNLIGEHTDYNEGFVLPMAINRAIWIAFRERGDQQVLCHSLDFGETLCFSLDHYQKETIGWGEYIKGSAWALQEDGYQLQGWQGVLAGDIPIGAGLSSSAAMEIATLKVFAWLSHLDWEVTQIAHLGQRAENGWVGVNCGIMDQMISAGGRAGHGLLIDCRSLETRAIPLPLQTVVAVLDTGTRRGLVDSAYNERRRQCETAAQFFGVQALRDVSFAHLDTGKPGLDATVFRRARHVIGENERTLQAAEAMQQGDALRLGELMDASHASLRDDFEVSSEELNRMVEMARSEEGCLGARMTGAGFGGCAVALVQENVALDFSKNVLQRYQEQTGLQAKVYICQASDGAEVVAAG